MAAQPGRGARAELEIGLAIYNAAYSFVAPLLERPLDDALRVVEVNVDGPAAPRARARASDDRARAWRHRADVVARRVPGLAAARRVRREQGVQHRARREPVGRARPHGVDVLVSCAGAIRTPGYIETAKKDAPGTLDPARVVELTLARARQAADRRAGRGEQARAPSCSGASLSRRAAIGIMARNTADLE